MTEESNAQHFSLMSVMWLIVFLSRLQYIKCKSPLLVVFFVLFMVPIFFLNSTYYSHIHSETIKQLQLI